MVAIGSEAVCRNVSICSIELSNNLETIGGSAFEQSSLNSIVNLPSTLTTIGQRAFCMIKDETLSIEHSFFEAGSEERRWTRE